MNWSNRIVAVTGAAGFIGSHLCETLSATGATVHAVDNFSGGTEEHLERVVDDVEIIDADIRTTEFEFFSDVDVVYHLAAIANPRACENDFEMAFNVNVIGTQRVFNAAQVHDCDRVVAASSAAVYGDPEYIPIDEAHPFNGNDPYARTKQMVELLAKTYYDNYDVEVTVTRNFNVFGPRHDKEYLIPTLIHQALFEDKIEIWSERTSRDFIFIDDMVAALLAVGVSEDLAGEAVNIGTGEEWSSKELADRISREFGGLEVVNLEKETTGSERLVCENTKLQRTTEWKQEHPFDEGLRRTIGWYRDNWTE